MSLDPTLAPPAAPADRAPPLAVMIVDDELFARTRLRSLVSACAEPRCTVVGEAADGAAALQWLRDNHCDVVLLDVAMPGLDGLHLADELRHRAQPPAVVFVTAHGEHALRAFELEATDYLTKPVRRERLQAALMRVAQRLQPRAADGSAVPMLVVADRGRVLRIPATEVLYLKAELKYVTLRTADAEWVLDEPLGDLEQRLGALFIRVHRNALVARRAVRALERAAVPAAATAAAAGAGANGGAVAAEAKARIDEAMAWVVVLTNGEQLSVSRRQLTAVREALASAAHG
ncbi:MAG: response regulator transcription factor [Ideonella sp.]|nr:response regulator transcription factor [Ideonella sp.]MCC7455417.1 response regulator transcription factor [Nitrospira sp.]